MNKQSLQGQKEFLSSLSHELRNPLATILSSVELMRLQSVHPPGMALLLETVEGRVHAITHTLSTMLEAANFMQDSGSAEASLPPLPLVALPEISSVNPPLKKTIQKILVIDDNELATDTLGKLLELHGHTVAVAYTGVAAIEQAKKFLPTIIILDIGLPDMDGYAVARALQEDPNFSSTLIALTGYGLEQDKKQARDAGFHYHLTKPIGIADIEEALQKV